MGNERLNVLLAETASPPAQLTAGALVEAGHAVQTCHDCGEDGLACAALRGRPCPLEGGLIDILVLVRANAGMAAPVEQGALCGVRRGVPLVVGGEVGGDPYRPWAAAEREGTDLVDLVEEVAAAPLPEHSRVATAALVESLRQGMGGYDFCSARVSRRAGELEVVLIAAPSPPVAVREAVATRVHQRLRALDRWTPRIKISFRGPRAWAVSG